MQKVLREANLGGVRQVDLLDATPVTLATPAARALLNECETRGIWVRYRSSYYI